MDFEKKINELVDELSKDYSGKKTIDRVLTFDQPDKEKIIDIIYKMQKIVFPGYFRNKDLRVYTRKNDISMPLEDCIFNLIKQIKKVLRYDQELSAMENCRIEEKAAEITFEFMSRVPKIRAYIETDLQAAFDGDPAAYNKDEIIFSYPGLFAIFVSRLAHELFELGVPVIPRMMTEYAHSQTGIDIHPGAKIGKYFFIDHGTGIVIGETTEIGDNVKIYQGVTLGALSTRGGQKLRNKKRHPTIKNNVTIYSGASILGGDTVIGENAVIGGNAFITTSVPDGARVSIKNPELSYNYDEEHPRERKELEQDDNWFYVI